MKIPREAREWLAAIGRKGGEIGGRASTPAKRRAARENGKLGGRPRKPKSTRKGHK